MSYTLYIYTFGRKCMRARKARPIEVGAAVRSHCRYPLRDDAGDNISRENEYYGELTGLYWIYKHLLTPPPPYNTLTDNIIGFGHYNKVLDIRPQRAERWLRERGHEGGFITLTPTKNRDHPVPDEVAGIEAVLEETGPEYIAAWHKLYDERAAGRGYVCRGGNMFICTESTFRDYAEWLFGVLAALRRRVGDKPQVEPNMRRYCAFIGERLLSVYIEAHHRPALGVDMRLARWWITYLGRIRRALHIDNASWLARNLSRPLGYRSQYGRTQ